MFYLNWICRSCFAVICLSRYFFFSFFSNFQRDKYPFEMEASISLRFETQQREQIHCTYGSAGTTAEIMYVPPSSSFVSLVARARWSHWTSMCRSLHSRVPTRDTTKCVRTFLTSSSTTLETYDSPSYEYEQKFQSLFREFTASRTFFFSTPWPASLHSTDVGKFILILNTRCAGVAPGQCTGRFVVWGRKVNGEETRNSV